MTPRTQVALMKLSMLAGGLLCFFAAMYAYSGLGVDLTRLPLWLNLAALIIPILGGMVLG